VGQDLYGGLVLCYPQERAFSGEDLELAYTFADQAALAIANDQLRNRAEETAVAMERNRLARDLHDAVTQTLFSASLIAEILPSVWESDQSEARDLLKELRRLSRGALAEMRTLLLELRPTTLVEADIGDLLRQLAETVTGRTGANVAVTVEGTGRLPSDVHVALYRIAQEALNNVVKHAKASDVSVKLHYAALPSERGGDALGQAELSVSDDGRGFDPGLVRSNRLGLGIMRERVEALGGELVIRSQPGGGTQIAVSWTGGSG
jgi:signal transduction histidine kinase